MRSGAFLQLILILIALISRLDIIVTELAEVLNHSVSVVQKAKQVLHSPRSPELQNIPLVQDYDLVSNDDIGVSLQHLSNNLNEPIG